MSHALSHNDLQEIARIIDIDYNHLSFNNLNSFTVHQLKEIIKWLRAKLSKDLSIQFRHIGRKAELIETVKRALQLFNFIHPNNSQIMYNNNPSQQYIQQTMAYNNGTSSSYPQPAQYAQTPSNTLFNGWNASYQQQQQQAQPQPQTQPQQNYNNQQQQQQNINTINAMNNTSSQTQYNVTTQHYSQLVQHPNFTNNRSPFYQVEKRCCVMPVFSQKRIQFRISLHMDDVNKILTSRNTEDGGKKGLHLRLFNFVTHEHQEWNTSQCDVSINNRKIIIDKRSTRSGVKKKGYHIVAPLDITKEACVTMDFEITSNGPFGGVAVIEIVRIFSVELIAARIVARCTPIDARKDKKCAICGRRSDLLRCSRCKSVWYCGTKHQAKDWPLHQTICSPTELKQKLKSISVKPNTDDDDVVCGETKVSLRCPLSICRINLPIRGTECTHPQCIDLNTFLAFSHKTGIWQCPVCLKPLKFNQVAIDNEMKDILKQTDDDIDLVRLYPNGSFKAITLEEQRQEEQNQLTKKKRKRRQHDREVNGNDIPPNLRKTNANANTNTNTSTSTSANTDNNNGNNSAPEDDNGQNLINPIVLD